MTTVVQAASQDIHVLRVNGTIVPVVADYIDEGISEAERARVFGR